MMGATRIARVVGVAALAMSLSVAAGTSAAHAAARTVVLGQPSLRAKTLGTRCSNADARFSRNDDQDTDGPTGIAIASNGRLFVLDDGGHRVMSWPNADALRTCQPADRVFGASHLTGPEAIAVDGAGHVFVADTLDQTIKVFSPSGSTYKLTHTIGTSGDPDPNGLLYFPRGLAVDESGRLFVADDYHDRVLIFDHPLTESDYDDSIGAGDNGGLGHPKAVAIVGDTLFVADYDNHRVLRFTGPFTTPDKTYEATAVFSGKGTPVDLAVGPDQTLYVADQDADGNAGAISTYPDAVLRTSNATRPGGHVATAVDGALGIALDPHGRMFVADYADYRVLVLKTRVAIGPVDPHATAATRKVLAVLRAAPGQKTNRVAIGQEMATWNPRKNAGWYRDFHRLHARKLPTPFIMSSELSYLESNGNDPAVATMIAHARSGGVDAIDWHPDNPIAGGKYAEPVSTASLRELVRPGTAAYTVWHEQLSRAAAALRKFNRTGVPVIFRPFVESNLEKYFWWGNDASTGKAHADRQAAFAALWDDTVHYLTVTKKLHDLLFDYSVNSLSGSIAALDYYPGPSHVDLTGVDVYQNSLNLDEGARGLNEYAELVHTGKPFGLSEFGQGGKSKSWDARILATRLRYSYPLATYAIAWYSSSGYIYGLSDLHHVAQLFDNPLIKTLER